MNSHSTPRAALLKAGSQGAVGGHSSGHQQGLHVVFFAGRHGAAGEIANHRSLKACNQVKSFPVAQPLEILVGWRGDLQQRVTPGFDCSEHLVRLNIAQHCRLDSAVAEVETLAVFFDASGALGFIARRVLELREGKFHRPRIAELRDAVDNRAAGVAQT